jgi:SAM-dependent methyltransferase
MDYGYDWPWTHGHLLVGIAALAGLGLALARRAPRWLLTLLGVVGLWGVTSFWIIQQRFLFNKPVPVPTARFLPGGGGRVLDLGAGSGRATVGVLRDREAAEVTAVDIFADSFGIPDNSAERLLRNVAAAGYSGRAKVQVGDMRKLPFTDEKFDAALSVAAVDHLKHDDVMQTFAEVRRVLRPGGEFLVMAINRDGWMRFVFPLLHGHYFGSRPMRQIWLQRFHDAGYEVIEIGTVPGALYILGRTPAAAAPPSPAP